MRGQGIGNGEQGAGSREQGTEENSTNVLAENLLRTQNDTV